MKLKQRLFSSLDLINVRLKQTIQLPLQRTLLQKKKPLPRKNALLTLKRRCLRNVMMTLNAITILLSISIKVKLLNLNAS